MDLYDRVAKIVKTEFDCDVEHVGKAVRVQPRGSDRKSTQKRILDRLLADGFNAREQGFNDVWVTEDPPAVKYYEYLVTPRNRTAGEAEAKSKKPSDFSVQYRRVSGPTGELGDGAQSSAHTWKDLLKNAAAELEKIKAKPYAGHADVIDGLIRRLKDHPEPSNPTDEFATLLKG